MRLNLLEIFLLQLIVYSALWLTNEFVASYLCIVLPGVIFAVLLISAIAELIEPSRISRRYFIIMAISVFTPLLTAVAFYILTDGQLDWLQNLSQ